MKYLLFGNGFIGNKFSNYLPDSVIAEDRIVFLEDVTRQIGKYNPDVVINCIGKTGVPNVDWCETHKEETFFSNVTVPAYMAEVCEELGQYMVHMGSGCIYEGDKRYAESSIPNFRRSFYSRTKLYSEQILCHYNNILQIRIRMPVDDVPSPKNLITKLTSYQKVISIANSVTCIPDLMQAASALIKKRRTGVYNVVNPGAITHKQILEMYKDIVDPEFIIPEIISADELNNITVAGRSNCTLGTVKLENEGISMAPADYAVAECLKRYRKFL
jgi:dTDP-4-dehydrorhamnose reductase